MTGANPYQELVIDAIRAAKRLGASDAHFQPEADGVEIRLRVHGDLRSWKRVAAVHRASLLHEVKTFCGLKLSVSLRPQDARRALPQEGLDLRASALPTLHGEKIVVRLLDRGRVFDLDRSGIADEPLAALRQAIALRSGVCLITGPTGSGKTTTLYSAIQALDRTRRNIVTIEDPIEYAFPGVTQSQLGDRMGFADALRAMLRQDPDVILFGEIRDPESADLCFQAAATGHLVLSTLHANGARAAIKRLRSLGVSEDRIRENLRFSSAQRLLARICAHCRRSSANGSCLRNPDGCRHCELGATGRIAILETLGRGEIGGRGAGNGKGFLSLAVQARRLAEQGLVDAVEAREVA